MASSFDFLIKFGFTFTLTYFSADFVSEVQYLVLVAWGLVSKVFSRREFSRSSANIDTFLVGLGSGASSSTYFFFCPDLVPDF